jgi:hypothetical protein
MQSDNGDGTYTNPVIAADFPDPDVILARYLRDNSEAKFVQSDTGISLINIADKHNEPDLIIKLTLK